MSFNLSMKFKILFTILIALIFVACKGEKKLADNELIEKNVRAFFFMGDSVQVNVQITDTIYVEELNEMLATIEENNRLIQQDIDTLKIMIDDWAYKAVDLEKNAQTQESKDAEIKSLEYRLKLWQIELKQTQFNQSNRIMLHLKRSIWANIAGFEATVHYELGDEINDIPILMDANFNVVD